MSSKLKKEWIFGILLIIFIIFIFPSGINNIKDWARTNHATNFTTPKGQNPPIGIDEIKFDKMVKEKILDIDSDLIISSVKTKVDITTGYVNLYLSDISLWVNTNETQKKEFINSMGKIMDQIAISTRYKGMETVGTVTRIFSSNGLELGVRTLSGGIILK